MSQLIQEQETLSYEETIEAMWRFLNDALSKYDYVFWDSGFEYKQIRSISKMQSEPYEYVAWFEDSSYIALYNTDPRYLIAGNQFKAKPDVSLTTTQINEISVICPDFFREAKKYIDLTKYAFLEIWNLHDYQKR